MATKIATLATIGMIPIALIQTPALQIVLLMVWTKLPGVALMASPPAGTKSLSLSSPITPMVSTLELGHISWTHKDQSINNNLYFNI